MNLKKIGISLRVETIEKYDERRDTISHDWINFLQKLNFVPILIPNNLRDEEIPKFQLLLENKINDCIQSAKLDLSA